MMRPCFLVVDREYSGSISTRKLVIETAKLNVITAYSSAEAIETLETFPAVNGAVLDAKMKDMPCGELVRRLRKLQPKLPIVVVGGPQCGEGIHYVESFNPQRLLDTIMALEPEKTTMLQEHDQQMDES